MNSHTARIIIYGTLAIGAGSLILFYSFLFFGPFSLFAMGLSQTASLMLDASLSMMFFLQHSIMIRRGVRARLMKKIPGDCYGAFYAVSSGAALFVMVLFWQRADTIAVAHGAVYWIQRVMFILSIGGFYWGIRSLGFFDPFGIEILKLKIRNIQKKPIPLAAKGPYRWVRHPLYLFSLIMIWANPELTVDKLLFNLMWSVWIIIATMLEERDLVSEFGDDYREYQSHVPMLIPYKIPGNS